MLLLCCPQSGYADNPALINQLLDRGIKAAQQNNCAEAIKLDMQARELARKENDYVSEFWALYQMGAAYYLILANGEAQTCYYEALKLCEKHNLGNKERAYVLNGISGIYYEENNLDKALTYSKQAMKYYLLAKDSATCITIATDIALISNKRGNFKESAQYTSLARKFTAPNDSESFVRIRVIEADALYKQHRYDDVIRIGNQIIGSKYLAAGDESAMLVYLINIYMKRGDLKKAQALTNRAIAIAPLRNKPEVFDVASTLYQKLGDYRQALFYKDSMQTNLDSITHIHDKQLVENANVKIEIMKLRDDMNRKAAQLRYHRLIAWTIVGVLLLIIIIVTLYARSRIVRNQLARQIMNMKLEKEKEAKQHLQTSLTKKEHELSATTAFVSARNQLISDLLEAFGEMPQAGQDPKIRKLALQLHQALHQQNESEKLYVKLEAEHPDFFKNLKAHHPKLSSSDLRFLGFIRMNLDVKEISHLMNITPDSCKKRKTRISQKLGLSNAAELYEYVCKF
jgi:tetratricopeptide (TPR) repeat protein